MYTCNIFMLPDQIDPNDPTNNVSGSLIQYTHVYTCIHISHPIQCEKKPQNVYTRGRKTQDARMHCIPESFCASGKFLRVYTKLTLKSSQLSGKFPDSLESFRTVWKVSGQSGKCPDSLESFRTVWKVSGQFGKIPDSLESFRTVWKNSGQSGKFPDRIHLRTFLTYLS